MSLFKQREILHGLPNPGDKVTYTKPTKFAFFNNIIDDEKLLVIDKEYTVVKVQLNSSSTYVYLKEFWIEGLDEYYNNQQMFNMHAFTWVEPLIDPKALIGLHCRDVLRLQHRYNIEFDEYPRLTIDPNLKTIVFEYDIKQYIITNAYFK